MSKLKREMIPSGTLFVIMGTDQDGFRDTYGIFRALKNIYIDNLPYDSYAENVQLSTVNELIRGEEIAHVSTVELFLGDSMYRISPILTM